MFWAFSFQRASAQTFGEWFSQRSTQRKYLLEQIAALKVYTGYLQKGYRIAQDGWSTVRDITNGEFGLHEAFYGALKTVSPVVRNDARVAEVIELELAVLSVLNGLKRVAVQPAYVQSVCAVVSAECLGDLSELLLVVTSGQLEMTDDERLKRLELICGRMREKAAFIQRFEGEVKLLEAGRQRALRDINQMRRWYEQD